MALPVNDRYSSIGYTRKATLRLLVTILIFISVSAAEKNDEPRRCHWCGPLAEQVHRSRRAPPCDAAGDHVTACEPGYQYCAVVATAPPYVESRFCVKLYQDECYPLYCNSTKTWKMTCPCRGDLCNGVNTEREEEAFGALTKLVAKTHNVRIKKRSVQESKDNTYGCCNNNSTQHVNEAEKEVSELKTPSQHKIAKTEWTSANDDNNVEKNNDNDMKSVDDNKIDGMQEEAKMVTTEKVMQKDLPAEITETTVVVTRVSIVTQAPSVITQTPMKNTIRTEERASMTNVKPTEQMPPAESLQQAAHNKENMEKPTEITSTETTVTMVTTTIVEETTTMSNINMSVPHKGFGVQIYCNFCMLLVSVMIFLATHM